MTLTRIITGAIGIVLLSTAAIFAFLWTFCRVTVDSNECRVVIRKSGKALPAGETIAEPGFKGIQRETLGPGRYFFNPISYETETVPLVEISAGDPNSWNYDYDNENPDYQTPKIEGQWPELGVRVSRVGKASPAGPGPCVARRRCPIAWAWPCCGPRAWILPTRAPRC